MTDTSQTIADLQARIAYQEDAIGTLNEVVARQDRELQDLQAQLQLLYKKLDDLKSEYGGIAQADSPPPHY